MPPKKREVVIPHYHAIEFEELFVDEEAHKIESAHKNVHGEKTIYVGMPAVNKNNEALLEKSTSRNI